MQKPFAKTFLTAAVTTGAFFSATGAEALSCWRMDYGGIVSSYSSAPPQGAVASVPCVQTRALPNAPVTSPPREEAYYAQQRDYQRNNNTSGGSCSHTPVVYACSRKLGDASSSAAGWGPFRHDYLCVQTAAGYVCGSQTVNNWWMYGRGQQDVQSVWNPQLCKPVSRDSSVASCVSRAFTEARPYYGVAGPGTNCQEWAKDVVNRCK